MSVDTARFRRDRVTWLVYLQIGVYGWILYAMGPAIQLLREETGVSKTVSGLHGTAMALGALATGFVGAHVVQRIGRRAALWLGLAGASAATVVFTSSRALAVTLLGAFLAVLFGSYVVNTVSTAMADYHRAAGSAAVSEAHGMAAAIGLLAPLALGGAEAIGLGWRVGLLLAVPFVAVIALGFRGVAVPDHREVLAAAEPAAGRLPRAYWWAWFALTCCVAVEFCVSIWSSVLLRERVGLGEGAAAAGVTALVAGMAAGRFAAGRLARSVSAERLMYGALALAALGWVVFWLATSPIAAFTGLVVCGLGVAFHFPIGVMRALGAAGGRADLASARASVGVGVAIGAGPFALGALADAVGTHTAFLVVPGLLLVAAFAVAQSAARAAPSSPAS